MPIHSSTLRTRIEGTKTSADGKLIELCPGCNRETHTLDHDEKKQIVPPYICIGCHLMGWRARGNWAYSPEDVSKGMVTPDESGR